MSRTISISRTTMDRLEGISEKLGVPRVQVLAILLAEEEAARSKRRMAAERRTVRIDPDAYEVLKRKAAARSVSLTEMVDELVSRSSA